MELEVDDMLSWGRIGRGKRVCLEGGVKTLARRTATGQFLHSIRKSRDKSLRICGAHERLSVATGWWELWNRQIHYDRFNQNEKRGRGSIRKVTPASFLGGPIELEFGAEAGPLQF